MPKGDPAGYLPSVIKNRARMKRAKRGGNKAVPSRRVGVTGSPMPGGNAQKQVMGLHSTAQGNAGGKSPAKGTDKPTMRNMRRRRAFLRY